MALVEQMYTRAGGSPRLGRFVGRVLLFSGGIFAIFLVADWATGRFQLWPLQLLGSIVIGTFAAVLGPLEKAELDKLRVDGLNLELLDLTDRMARLDDGELAGFAALLDVGETDVESITAAGSGADGMWRSLVDAGMAARCDPGEMEAAAPRIRRYALTPKGRLALELIVAPAIKRRLRAEPVTFGRKPEPGPAEGA